MASRCTSCSAATTAKPASLAEEDYHTYLHWLAEALAESQCKLHAYVLMTNTCTCSSHPQSKGPGSIYFPGRGRLMPCPAARRVHLDGQPLHIVQRGHNREACFLAEEDYHTYLHWLAEALAESQCKLHAYVLMTNHVHLLLTPRHADTIPRLIISLGRRYVQYINQTHRRTGTLWDSRYKSSLIHADSYLLACQRYIELNPYAPA